MRKVQPRLSWRLPLLLLGALALNGCVIDDDDSADSGGSTEDSGVGPQCEGPDPSARECVSDDDCAEGHACEAIEGGCIPSICQCTEDGWMCTADCGQPTGCVPIVDPCDAPNPAVPLCLVDDDCPAEHACEIIPGECRSSACSCEDGMWACTADCGPYYECVPRGGACEGPNPATLVCAGDDDCPAGHACEVLPDGCRPSACSCDPESGWTCTADCGQATACVPNTLACADPDPSASVCAQDADCPADHTCELDAQACAPSHCECQADLGQWSCTDDCNPANVCVPSTVEVCGDETCAPGSRCVDGRCLPLGAPCVDDFTCVDGYCDDASRQCVSLCPGDLNGEIICDALPPVCAIGETLVGRNGCHACVDARTCEDPEPVGCWGAWLDEAGTCRAPNDGAYPDECCTLPAHRHFYGLAEPACAPDDGPAIRITLGVGLMGCGEIRGEHIRITLFDDALPRNVPIDVGGLGFGVQVQYCTAPGECQAPPMAQIMLFDPAIFGSEYPGRVQLLTPSGQHLEAAFSAESCVGPMPGPMCG